MKYIINIASLILLLSISLLVNADQESTEVFSSKNYMFLVLEQEKDGKRGYKIKYDRTKKRPETEKFNIVNYEVKLKEYPFEPGMQTLLFHIKAKTKGEKRNLYVLYNGFLSFIEKGTYFYVTEDRNKSIKYYSMYNGKPNRETIKNIIKDILKGDRQPLLATKWAENGKESVVIKFDEKLK